MNNAHRKHYPAEIFGYPIENKSKVAEQVRKEYLCPFSNKERCSKQSRLLTCPMGICSTWWPNNSPIAICPKRLLQDKTIFINAANHVFGNTNNVLLFSEVKLKRINGVGRYELSRKDLLTPPEGMDRRSERRLESNSHRNRDFHGRNQHRKRF